MKSVRKIKAALFDLYDTLSYADERRFEEKVRACASLCNVRPEDYAAAWKSLLIDSNLGKLGGTEKRALAVLRMFGLPEDERVAREITRLEHEFLRSGIHLHDDAVSTLTALRTSGLKLGLITNASPSVREVFDRHELWSYFDCVIISSEVGLRKPEPGIYLAALNRLEFEPWQCVYIGDGNDGELDGAHDVGMLTVCVERGGPKYFRMKDSLPSSVNYTVSTLAEVIPLVNGYEY